MAGKIARDDQLHGKEDRRLEQEQDNQTRQQSFKYETQHDGPFATLVTPPFWLSTNFRAYKRLLSLNNTM